MRETTLQTPRAVKKEVLQTLERYCPAAHGENHGEVGCLPAAYWGWWWNRHPPAAQEGSYSRTKEAVTLWEAHSVLGRTCGRRERGAHSQAGLLAELLRLQERLTLEEPVPEGLHYLEETCTGIVCDKLQPMERIQAREILAGLSPVGSHTGVEKGCEESFSWRGRSTRNNIWWTDCNSHSLSHCVVAWRR